MYKVRYAAGQPGAASTSPKQLQRLLMGGLVNGYRCGRAYRRHQGLMAEAWKAETGSDGDLCEDRELRDEGRTVR